MAEFPLRKISELYHEDAGFRAAADRDARAALAERGVHFDGPGEVRLAANSAKTTYVVFPPAPNAAVPDGALDGVVGGRTNLMHPYDAASLGIAAPSYRAHGHSQFG